MNEHFPYYVYNHYPNLGLSPEEQQLVAVLSVAIKQIGSLYKKQINKKYPHGNFYPYSVTKQAISEAAEKNNELLSQFTVVKCSNDEGKLVAVPYNIYYHDDLAKIELCLRRAQKMTNDKHFNNVIEALIQAMHDNSYEEMIVAWSKENLSRLSICLGPMEPYEDRLFYRKYAYQGWVGVINEELTQRCEQMRKAIVRIRRTKVYPAERLDFLKKTRVRVEDTIAAGGLMVDYRFSAETLPNRPDLIEEHGIQTVLFTHQIHETFETRHLEAFNRLFERRFRDSFSRGALFRAYLYLVLLHEFARYLTRYKDASPRLQELYPVFNEMVVEVFAVRLASQLLLKDIITDKEFEAILVIFICRTLDGFAGSVYNTALKAYQKSEIDAYIVGNAIMLNTLLESGSIRHQGGISWPNFVKVFLEIEHMIDPVESILAGGTYDDARAFIEKNGSLEGIQRLSPRTRVSKESRSIA